MMSVIDRLETIDSFKSMLHYLLELATPAWLIEKISMDGIISSPDGRGYLPSQVSSTDKSLKVIRYIVGAIRDNIYDDIVTNKAVDSIRDNVQSDLSVMDHHDKDIAVLSHLYEMLYNEGFVSVLRLFLWEIYRMTSRILNDSVSINEPYIYTVTEIIHDSFLVVIEEEIHGR